MLNVVLALECWPKGACCPAVITGAIGDKLEVQLYTSQTSVYNENIHI